MQDTAQPDAVTSVFGALHGARAQDFKNLFSEAIVSLYKEKKYPATLIANRVMTDEIMNMGQTPTAADVVAAIAPPMMYVLETYDTTYMMFLTILHNGIKNSDPVYAALLDLVVGYVHARIDPMAHTAVNEFMPPDPADKIVDNAWWYANEAVSNVSAEQVREIIAGFANNDFKKFLEKFNEIYVGNKEMAAPRVDPPVTSPVGTQTPSVMGKDTGFIFEKEFFWETMYTAVTDILGIYETAKDDTDIEVGQQLVLDDTREKLDKFYTAFFTKSGAPEDEVERRLEAYMDIATGVADGFLDNIDKVRELLQIYYTFKNKLGKKYRADLEEEIKAGFRLGLQETKKQYRFAMNWDWVFKNYDSFYTTVVTSIDKFISATTDKPNKENPLYEQLADEAEKEYQREEARAQQKEEQERERVRKMREEQERAQEAETRRQERLRLQAQHKQEQDALSSMKATEDQKRRELDALKTKQDEDKRQLEKQQQIDLRDKQARVFEEAQAQNKTRLDAAIKTMDLETQRTRVPEFQRQDNQQVVDIQRRQAREAEEEKKRIEEDKRFNMPRVVDQPGTLIIRKLNKEPVPVAGLPPCKKDIVVDMQVASKKLHPQTDARQMTMLDLMSMSSPARINEYGLHAPPTVNNRNYQHNLYMYFRMFLGTTIFSPKPAFQLTDIPPQTRADVMKAIEYDTEQLIPGFVKELSNMYKRHMVMFTGSGASENNEIFNRVYTIAHRDYAHLYKTIFTAITIPVYDCDAYVDRIVDLLMIKFPPPVKTVPPIGPAAIELVDNRNLRSKTLLYRRSLMLFVYPHIMANVSSIITTRDNKTSIGSVGIVRRVFSNPDNTEIFFSACTPYSPAVKCTPNSQSLSVCVCAGVDTERVANLDTNIMGLVNRLLNNSITQNLMYVYHVSTVSNAAAVGLAQESAAVYFYENIDRVFDYGVPAMTFTEWIMTPRQPFEVVSVYFQIFHAMYVLQEYLGLVFYKLSPNDIRIVPVNACGYWQYVVDGVTYNIPNYGYLALVGGYHNLTKMSDTATKTKHRIWGTFARFAHDKLCAILKSSPNYIEVKRFRDMTDIFSISLVSRTKSLLATFSWKSIIALFKFFIPVASTPPDIIDTLGDNPLFKYKYNPHLDVVSDMDGNAIYGTYKTVNLTVNNVEKTFNIYGFSTSGNKVNTGGYDKYGYDIYGLDVDGYNRKGYNVDGIDRLGFSVDGYDAHGFTRVGFNRDGFDRFGYNINGYSVFGFDRTGYNIIGFDMAGYNRAGFDTRGFDRAGYDIHGFDAEGYDITGFNSNGTNKQGYSKQGFDNMNKSIWGVDKQSYSNEGYDAAGFDAAGYDRAGYDRAGYDPSGLDVNGVPRVRNILGRKLY